MSDATVIETAQTPPPAGGVPASGGELGATPPVPGDAPLAAGGDGPKDPPPYWPEDWRQKAAERVAGGDQKKLEKELRRLEKIADPAEMYGSYRSIENTWGSKQFVKLPGQDAKPEDVAEFHKALGVPEAPEAYLKDLKLDNGLVLGDLDKAVVSEFAPIAHQAGMTQPQVSGVVNWFLKRQEDAAAELDQADETHKSASVQELKNEYGAPYQRYINNVGTLFSLMPGGEEVKDLLFGGRTADGKMVGNDPRVIRSLVWLANQLNPAGTVVDDATPSGKGIDAEIAEIEKIMRTDRPRYNKEFANRYTELLAAREKVRANSAR